MKIEIVAGSGSGKTKLSAFDRALYDAGVANYNLIPLSSVIPPNIEIVLMGQRVQKEAEYGHKLYVVMADAYATQVGEQAWAGLGWVNHKDKSGKGLFVEHCGKGEQEVINLITNSLNSMAEYRPEEKGEIHHFTKGVECDGRPVCSIVIAVYKSEGWD